MKEGVQREEMFYIPVSKGFLKIKDDMFK